MKYIVLLLYITATFSAASQSVKKGEVFPYKTPLVFQYGLTEKASIPGLKGKHIILDFFAAGCLSCFKAMPKVQEFQTAYRDRIQFLLIGLKDNQIDEIYNRMRLKFKLNLPVAFDSAIFSALKIAAVPVYIWIGTDGKIFAVTSSDEITKDNIDAFLAGRAFLTRRERTKIPFDPAKPLLINGNGGADSIYLMRSVLSFWTPGQESFNPPSIYAENSTFQVMRATLSELYLYAGTGAAFWSTDHSYYGNIYPKVLWQDSISQKMVDTHLYNYSLTVPDTNRLREALQKDLEKTFGWTLRKEWHEMPCWNLVRTSENTSNLVSTDTVYSGQYNYGGMKVRGFPMEYLIEALQIYKPIEPPFINCTGIKGRVDLNMAGIMGEISDIRRELRKNGLDLQKATKCMMVIVVENKK